MKPFCPGLRALGSCFSTNFRKEIACLFLRSSESFLSLSCVLLLLKCCYFPTKRVSYVVSGNLRCYMQFEEVQVDSGLSHRIWEIWTYDQWAIAVWSPILETLCRLSGCQRWKGPLCTSALMHPHTHTRQSASGQRSRIRLHRTQQASR